VPVVELLRQKQLYDKEYARCNAYELENWRISYIMKIFGALRLRNEDIFLDIGVGGTGYTVIEAARYGIKAIGIDLSAEGMKKAKGFSKVHLSKECFCEFIICSATHIPLRTSSVSKIASVAVLEHIPNDETVLDEVARISTRDSSVFLVVPNSYSRMLPPFSLPYVLHDKRVGHLRHYKAEVLIEKLAKRSFRFVKIFYSVHIPKILQYFLGAVLGEKTKMNSRMWWQLERLDSKMCNLPTGFNISLCLKKRDEQSENKAIRE